MIIKCIKAFGEIMAIGCDGQCNKAWGISCRPKILLSDDEDDYEYLSDGELEEASMVSHTSEGGHMKPMLENDRLNKWCFRQCERLAMADLHSDIIKLPNFTSRISNIKKD